MVYSKEKLDSIPVHFILCTERTGSSLLSLMLNLHPNILSPSEEPFALYFWKKYRNKENWSEDDIVKYVDQFFLLAEKNTDLYFSKREFFLESLIAHRSILNYQRLVKLTYLHFIDTKDKSDVSVIVDKQIKYFFYLKQLKIIFPDARFIVLSRDVRDNIVSKQNRSLNWNQHPLFLAGLWRDSYANVSLLNANEHCKIQYEQFVLDTVNTLTTVCNFVGLEFEEVMMETEGIYANFLDEKKNDVDPAFIKRLQSFHSGLSSKMSDSKIGQYKNALDNTVLEKVECICGFWLNKMGYEISSKKKLLGVSAIYHVTLARCYRKYLLKFYLFIPFRVKLFFKQIRKTSKNV